MDIFGNKLLTYLLTYLLTRSGLCLSPSEVTLEATDEPGEWTVLQPPAPAGNVQPS